MKKEKFFALIIAAVMLLGVLPGVSLAAERTLTIGDKVTFNGIEYVIATENLITNGDFEDDFADWHSGTGAPMTADNFTIEATGGSDGGKFLTSKKHTGATDVGAAYRSVEVEPSTAYYHTYNIKANDATEAGTDYVVSYLVSKLEIGKETNNNATVSGQIGGDKQGLSIRYTDKWTPIETVLVGNANAQYFTFNARWLGSGAISFDEVALYKVYPADKAAKILLKIHDEKGNDLKTPVEMYAGVDGQEYTVPESYTPATIEYGGAMYLLKAAPTVTLSKTSVTEVVVVYSLATISSVEAPKLADNRVIAGYEPVLPTTLTATLSDGKTTIPVSAVWSTNGNTDVPGKVTYTASVNGYEGMPVTVEIEVLSCDHSIDTFYSSGNANGAVFAMNNRLGLVYSGGTVIFEATLHTNQGSNKLISYSDEFVGAFDDVGPMIRYMNNGFFEYNNGGAWTSSAVPCEPETEYRLLWTVNVDAQTWSLKVAGSDGVYRSVADNARFRSGAKKNITMMMFHGDGVASGQNNDVITSHCAHWVDGWTEVTINHTVDNVPIIEPVVTKATTGRTFKYTDVQKVIIVDGKTYALPDFDSVPELENVGPEKNVLNVEYNEAVVTPQIPEVSTVVGQEPVMPSRIKFDLGEERSVLYGVTWNTSGVDISTVGDYTAAGRVTELNFDIEATVHVRDIIPDDGAELGKVSVATNNGGWNWYVEPSGTHIQPGDELATRYESGIYSSNNGYKFQHDRTYMGWVEDDGTIVVSQYDHDTDEYKRVVLHEKLESDDHNNPAVVVLPDGRIMAVYTMHTNEPYMYFRVTKNPEDISEWHAEQFYYCETKTNMETGLYNATYPTIFLVHDDEGIEGNDVIYAGWRGVHWKPTLAKFPMPDENGRFGTDTDGRLMPVMGQTQIANTSYYDFNNGGRKDSNRRPYTKYDYDFVENKIYITFTANHPDNDSRNHIYYFYLNIEDQTLYTANDNRLQPLPKENQAEYSSQGAVLGSSGQWGVETLKVYKTYPELVVFDASELTGTDFENPNSGSPERRGWTWDIAHNEKGEPCIVYADITATPPEDNGSLPSWYVGEVNGNTRSHHYYWYARWDSETKQWVKTFLTYGGKWFHQNATQERCYSGGLTFDHNYPGNVLYLAIPTEGDYGNVFEIYRWESDDDGATWTKRQAITQNSPTSNARPNAIYNYKMNEDGTNAGPRLLWISGEYRYWMNYEYKTGVKTDFPGMITQDDPEMFAAVSLTSGGAELDKLPDSGNEEITAKFNISNISIGDGNAKLALAHYGADGSLKGIKTVDKEIPARSVPQTGVLGADKDAKRANGLSAMGEEEVIVEIAYAPENSYAVGDRVKLFAWNMGIERQLNPIMEIPYEISTSGSRYLFSDYFTYEGDDKLVLTGNEATTYNGWIAKAYSGKYDYNNDWNYVAVTKAPFGNTGLHIYRHGNGGLMVSHALPDTEGKDYTLEFTMRHIDEWSWNNTDNQGFTLSHGVPTGTNDSTNSHSAFQYRYGSAWRDENGRGTSGRVRNSLAFDGGNQTEIFHNVPLGRDLSDADRYVRKDYSKGEGYYDKVDEIYIHDYIDSLYTGALFRIRVDVCPGDQMIYMSVGDGYRTAYYSTPYVSGYDWDANPIDTITFSIGNEKWGEVYIDDFRMYLSEESSRIRTVYVDSDGAAPLSLGREWTILPMADGSNVFFNADVEVLDVTDHKTEVGAGVGVYSFTKLLCSEYVFK